MGSIIDIARKDLKLLTRDKGAMFFLFAFPIMMGVFFGFIYQGMGKKSSGGIKIAIVDNDQSEMSGKFVEHLKANENLTVVELPLEQAKQKIRDKDLVGVVVVTPGFGENAGVLWSDQPAKIRIGKDPSRMAASAMLEGYVMESVGQLIPERLSDVNSLRGTIEKQRDQIKNDPDIPAPSKLVLSTMFGSMLTFFEDLNAVQEDQSNEEIQENAPSFQLAEIESFDAFAKQGPAVQDRIKSGWDISFPSAILWGVMGCASGFAISLVRERSRGTLMRLQTAPITNTQLIAGKGLACFTAILAVVGFMTVLGIALGMRPEQPLMLIISAMFIAFCYVGIMMAMSVLGNSEEAVGGAGWAINVILAMFGGGMIPLLFLPNFMQTFSNFSPVAWSILSLEGAIYRGFGFSQFLKPWGILAAIGIFGFAIGIFVLQRKKS